MISQTQLCNQLFTPHLNSDLFKKFRENWIFFIFFFSLHRASLWVYQFIFFSVLAYNGATNANLHQSKSKNMASTLGQAARGGIGLRKYQKYHQSSSSLEMIQFLKTS